jgi:predicted HicB family RNase H-like nuclease
MNSRIHESCVYAAGPYKGYLGQAQYDEQSGLFHGEVIGTKDVITFQAETFSKLRRAFCGSVDDYLDFCRQRGERPDKPFSGKFVARISPNLHRQLSLLAQRRGKSLNSVVEQCLERLAKQTGGSSGATTQRLKRPPRKAPHPAQGNKRKRA